MKYELASTVSPEAVATIQQLAAGFADIPPMTSPPRDHAEWDIVSARAEAFLAPIAKMIVDTLGVEVREDRLGDVPVLRIRAPGATPDGRKLIYVHGGAYVYFSARSTLVTPSLMALATGIETISIDYTLAPRGTWQTVLDQVVSVYRALLADKTEASAIGMLGDSAGGGLVAGATLKFRDLNLPLPGALYLLSPWSDITSVGDTAMTLAELDPVVNLKESVFAADAYVPREHQHHPYVSPVYGDYSKPFPPTLIQAGTREVLLSACVRHYQSIKGGGHDAVLDVYEGMPHVFQSMMPTSPESQTAIARAAGFFEQHLSTGLAA